MINTDTTPVFAAHFGRCFGDENARRVLELVYEPGEVGQRVGDARL